MYTTLHSASDLAKTDSFTDNDTQIIFLQSSMLLALSMLGGVLVPAINAFVEDEKHIRISWDSGTVDQFSFGKVDEGFLRFFSYFQDRLSSRTAFYGYCACNIVWYSAIFANYVELLKCSSKRITLLAK